MRGLAFSRAYVHGPSWIVAVVLATLLFTPATALGQIADAPPDTAVTTGPADPTSKREANFSFTGSDDITPVDELEFECRLDSQDEAAWVSCLSPQFFSDLVVGQHAFEVRAIDAEENIDPTPALYAWTILPPQTCQEASGTAEAEADSWIDEHAPLDNKGDDSVLKVQSKDPSEDLRALVRFALPIAPAGCVLESATLRLYAASATPDRTLQALQLASAWGEHNVTWDSQPAISGSPALTATSLGYLEWNVTSQVQAMYSEANHGFLIRDASEGDPGGPQQQLHSREKLEAPPELVMRFVAPAPPPAPPPDPPPPDPPPPDPPPPDPPPPDPPPPDPPPPDPGPAPPPSGAAPVLSVPFTAPPGPTLVLPGGGGAQPARPSAAEIIAALKGDLRTAAKTLRRLGIARSLRRRGASVRGVSALARGQVRMEATFNWGGRRGPSVTVLEGRRSFAGAGEGTLRLKPRLLGRQLLADTRWVRLTLRASFTDGAGQRTAAPSRTVMVER